MRKPPVKIQEAELRGLMASGVTQPGELAKRMGADRNSVRRAIVRFGIREPQRGSLKYTEVELERIRILTLEGMPLTFIAEDLGRSIKSVQKRAAGLPGSKERNHLWHKMWGEIMHNDELLKLHREITPKKSW